MTTTAPDWEQRIAELWKTLDDRTEDDFLARMRELVKQAPENNAPALFEQACAFDSTGHSDLAVPLYQQALRIGLTGVRRRRAVIQMASSLRNLDRAPESVALLTAELHQPSDELDDAVRATLALALVNTGREREAVALLLTALARHLPRYQRSMTNYARMLVDESAGGERPSGPEGEIPGGAG